MAQSISDKIHETFFANLAQSGDVRPEAIERLKTLHQIGKLADKKQLAQLAQEMESRHAQDQNADC
jgi:hypothetical protein